MKIALAHIYFYPQLGGVEIYLKHLADEYTKMGHEVSILVPASQKNIYQKSPYQIVPLPVFNFFGYWIPRLKTKKILEMKNFDVLHVNSPLPYATVLGWLAKDLKIKVVSTYHADVNPAKKWLQIGAKLEKKSYRKIFEHIIVTTPFYKNRVASFYPKEKISVVPLGIDELFLRSAADEKHGTSKDSFNLFVGALDKNHYYKGIETLLACAAMQPLREYVLVGDGDMKKIYQNKIKEAGLKNIQFLGNVSSQELKKLYQKATMLVLPSNSSSEGYGMVLLEAMACGTPVITTNCTGSHEEIAAANAGLIIKPNNSQLLKIAMEELLQDQKLYKKLVKNGLEFTKNRSWREIAFQTIKWY